ncbi:MAG: ABC transporter ATP-binding protein [Nitrospirae bacterium]|nr:MAG: ABC transporter ATP-binding protein [Nitrospirota bacterium]
MRSLFRILAYLRTYPGLVAATFSCAALTTTFDLVPPWLVKLIIDDVIQAKRLSWLPWVLVALVAAYGFKTLCNSLRIRFNNTLEQRVIFHLRQEVFAALQRLSLSYFEDRSTGEIMSRVMSDTEHVERIFIDGIEGMLTATLTLVGISLMLFILNWKLALLALLPLPILVMAAWAFSRRVHRCYHAIRSSVADLNAYLQDALSGIREIMGFHRQSFEQARFSEKSWRVSQDNLQAMYLWSLYSPGMMFLGSMGTVLILWYGAGEVVRGDLTVGELVAFLSYLALFYVPVNQIHSVNHLLQHALAASERIFEVLDTKPAVEDRPGLPSPPASVRGDIEFRHVVFGYRPEKCVIHGVSFHVQPGERVALVGPSGAGKSTVVKLLMRLYDVQDGAILLDGIDLRDLPLAFVRSQIGYVQQEPFLFNGTVRENIAYGNLQARMEEIERVAWAARAHEFICHLPQGYETWIGERGVKLSVGQKQRIAIARVLLKNPPIVIFDEATSNIDPETEVRIREALEELTKDRTTFIIAHRLSTLQQVDRIFVLDHGYLVEDGDHETLLARGGIYASLYQAQFQV